MKVSREECALLLRRTEELDGTIADMSLRLRQEQEKRRKIWNELVSS